MEKLNIDEGFEKFCEFIAERQESKENLNITQIRACMSTALTEMVNNAQFTMILLGHWVKKAKNDGLLDED